MGFPRFFPLVWGSCVWHKSLGRGGVMGIWEYNCLQLGKMRSNDGLDVGILMTKNATCIKFGHSYLSEKISVFVA